MKHHCIISLLILFLPIILSVTYDPTWDSLDKRVIPSWYDDARVGIFLHWGVYSVPSNGEWFWYSWRTGASWAVDYMKANYPPDFTYADFAPMFHSDLFNASEWANLFRAAGARYVVLTSKHHEGFTNWPSAYSYSWNSQDVGPSRDLVSELSNAVKAAGLHFGVYHSLLEWFHPLYLTDKANGWRTQLFSLSKAVPELYELVRRYQPELIWGDGDWEAPSQYWNSTTFLAWLYNESPIKDHVVVNDRWGSETRCVHGDFWDCDDSFNPGKLMQHKWESCQTLDSGSWGFRRTASLQSYRSAIWVISMLVHVSAYGGNLLLNAGPRDDGRIDPVFELRLRQMGAWLGLNGEAIYGARVWSRAQNDSLNPIAYYTLPKGNASPRRLRTLSTESVVYSIVLAEGGSVVQKPRVQTADYPFPKESLMARLHSPTLEWRPNPELNDWAGPIISLGSVNASEVHRVTLLGFPDEIQFAPRNPAGIQLTLPNFKIDQGLEPYQWAFVFKLEGSFA